MAVTTQFLTGLRDILKRLDGEALRDWLKVEPPLPQEYYNLASELKSSYQDDSALEKLVEKCLPEEDDVPEGQGTTWPGFISFIKDYFLYWRDVEFDDLLGAHQLLTALTKYNSKSYLAAQLLTNIMAKSPPLSYYPAAQRVTFLYFLGRFHFNHNHFWRAAQCFQEAYSQTPPRFLKHRRIILTYLIPSNFILGRLPSQALLQRPEAQSMAQCYSQLSLAIRKGDYILYQHTIKQHEGWLRSKGFPLFTTLQWRIRPLLWRSLSRRTFLLTYTPPADDDSRKAAVLKLADLYTTMNYVQKRLEGYLPAQLAPKGRQSSVNSYLLKAVSNSAGTGTADSTIAPPPGGPKHLAPDEGLLSGNTAVDDHVVENIVASLIGQDLLHGYIAHSQGAFAIMGTKQKGSAVAAGWPTVSEVIDQRSVESIVPGWVKDE
ncbi:hypothetical protein K445DRAFT_317643 [Daldinia sp. EC12]|nr:hypothetical protein K445DRAFT_317643 [Daldinia sp. EC12]